jgi:prepilin-type N-terminal cleavage/methylation domain-containing protein
VVTLDHPGWRRVSSRRPDREGFTLLELVVVVAIAAILLSLAVGAFSGYNERSAARRAAQVFARDLALARSMAVRGREAVVIRFYEGSQWYEVTTASGRQLARRRFGPDGDVNLSAVDLDLAGDSLKFSNRGVGDLAGDSIGTATFTAGPTGYQVNFNSMGVSKVGEV